MKFTKTTVEMQHTFKKGQKPQIVRVSGYEYQYALADGGEVRMHVCKHEGDWRVVDPNTGMYLCKGSKTRDDAVKLADSMEVKPAFTNLVRAAKYGRLISEFDAARRNVQTKPKAPSKPKAKTAAEQKAKAPKPRKKPTPKKDDALEAALKELAELRAMVESITAEKSAPVQEQATTVSLDAILKEAQEWCKDKPNVSAYRKNQQPSTPVRIAGETKPYEDELRDKGFRWSRKGFWYMGERELAAR